jgi:hypothetical protein
VDVLVPLVNIGNGVMRTATFETIMVVLTVIGLLLAAFKPNGKR